MIMMQMPTKLVMYHFLFVKLDLRSTVMAAVDSLPAQRALLIGYRYDQSCDRIPSIKVIIIYLLNTDKAKCVMCNINMLILTVVYHS